MPEPEPKLVIGDLMQMTTELIEQVKEDRLNGNIVTVRVKEIDTHADGTKTLWLERA